MDIKGFTTFFAGMAWGFAVVIAVWLMAGCTSGPMVPEEPGCTIIWVPGDEPVEVDLNQCGFAYPRGWA